MKSKMLISFVFFIGSMLVASFSFAQLEPITDIDIPCQKVLQIDGDKALGVNHSENIYTDIVLFDINTGEVEETREGVIYKYAEYDNIWYFYMQYAQGSADTWVMSYSAGELTLLTTYMAVCYDMWVVPELDGIIGSTPTGITLFREGAILAELELGERVLGFVSIIPGFLAITSHNVYTVDDDFDLVSSFGFPDGWESFEGAFLDGTYLLTNPISPDDPFRSLATYNPDAEGMNLVVNTNGEEAALRTYLLPVGEIEGQFLLAGNGQYAKENNLIVTPSGSGLVNPNSGVFTDFSINVEVFTKKLHPILKQTSNGSILFGRMGYEGIEPYKITSTGIEVLKDVYPGFGNSLNYRGYSNNAYILPLKNLNHLDIFSKNDILYFSAISPGLGNQIWRSDGTAAGTVAITNLSPETKGFKQAFFSEDGDYIIVSLKHSDNKTHLYKLDEGAPPVTDTLPNNQNWEVTYTINPSDLSGMRVYTLNQPEPLLADDGSIVFLLEAMDPYTDYLSLNQKWVLPRKNIPGFYFRTAVQFLESDGSLRTSTIIKAYGYARKIIARNAANGHVFVVISHLSGFGSENSDLEVNDIELFSDQKGHFILELDNSGVLVKSKFLPTGGEDEMEMSSIKIGDDGIYILGQAKPGFSMNGVAYMQIDYGEVRTVVFKYDFNLKFLWSAPFESNQLLFGPGMNTLEIDDTHVYASSGGAAYTVSSSCSYDDWTYRIASITKSDGNKEWEQTCTSDDIMKITDIRPLDNGQLWLGGYTRGNMSIGGRSLSIIPNYVNCGDNGFIMVMSKSSGSAVYLRHNDPSRLKFVQDIDFVDQLIYTLSLVYEKTTFPVPIYGYEGRWSLQIDRLNTNGILVDSLRFPTTMSRYDYGQKLRENKFSMELHPEGGIILTGEQMWNGGIDGLTAMPLNMLGMHSWLIQRREELSFLKALNSLADGGQIQIYPNPTNGNSVSFSFGKDHFGKYQEVAIYSSEGRLISNQLISDEFNHHIIELNRQMANGIYLLKLSGTGGEETAKFMVLR